MKFLSTLLLVAAIAFQSQAQDLILGIKGGFNYASVQTDLSAVTDPEESGRAGYHAGLYAGVKFSKIAIVPEVQFSVQNVEVELPTTVAGGTAAADNIKSEFNSAYFNVPVMIRFYPISLLYLAVGPQFGFASSQELKAAGGSVADADAKLDALEGSLKSSEISAAVGAGVNLPFGLLIEARYNIGLSNTLSDVGVDVANSGLDLSSEDDLKNSVFQLSIGYNFM